MAKRKRRLENYIGGAAILDCRSYPDNMQIMSLCLLFLPFLLPFKKNGFVRYFVDLFLLIIEPSDPKHHTIILHHQNQTSWQNKKFS
jgi:hypothetical protein